MSEIKHFTPEKLAYYHAGLKVIIDNADAATLAAAKAYCDGLADNYDPAGKAQTLYDLLKAEVDQNTAAIAKLNGEETEDGSVAKAVKDAKDALQTNINAVDGKVDKNAEDITTLQGRMTTAEGDIDAVETDLGNVDSLSTTNKTVVGAINEVLTAVGTGGTAAAVTITTDTTTEGALKSYTIKQGTTTVGVIDIPKDMVVESGSVVKNPEGQAEGTYIKLVLANVADPLYINVGALVDIYTAKAGATQVQLSIDSATREISATIVAGSIGSTELADDAVTTVKIADANVTLAKLSASVQASLAKADAAAPQTALDEEVSRAKAAETKVLEDANAHADELNTAMDTRVKAVEGKAHEHANKDELDKIAEGDVAKWNAAEQNVKVYADGKVADEVTARDAAIATAKTAAVTEAGTNADTKDAAILAQAKEYADSKVDGVDLSGIKTNADDIDKLEASLAEGGATATAIASAQAAADKAQGEVDALEQTHATDKANLEAADTALGNRVTALEEVQHVEITEAEIDAILNGTTA